MATAIVDRPRVARRLWTRAEYHRLVTCGILKEDDKVELIEGRILEKMPRTQARRWSRAEYENMVRAGILNEDEKVELIEGEIIEKMPKNRPHSNASYRSRKALERVFGDGFMVEQESPLALLDFSEPEPDLSVIRGSPDDYAQEHPRTALLLVEISESSLHFDRNEKASLYAKAGISDYWMLNLVDRQLEVYRKPVMMPEAAFGYGYSQVTIFRAGDFINPLAKPDARIAVADLLP